MTWELVISCFALLASALAALYARWTAREAKRANELSQLNSLLALRSHYLELMRNQENLAEILKGILSGLNSVHHAYADLDIKLREINHSVDKFHIGIISRRT